MKTFAKIWLGLVALVGIWALVFHPLYLLIAIVVGLGGGGFTWHCVQVLLFPPVDSKEEYSSPFTENLEH